ncbi:MAG: aminoglycoside phosphotransferase family protein [Candidatus Eisenbacteria bacterium]
MASLRHEWIEGAGGVGEANIVVSFFVPAALREAMHVEGESGTGWLERLPTRVPELERAWELTVGRAFDGGTCAWVAPVRHADGSKAVLKIGFPSREARHESDALRCFDGHGAVRLLRASEDGSALLLERCSPGNDLWTMGGEERDALGADVLRRLWRDAPLPVAFDSLSGIAQAWGGLLSGETIAAEYDPGLIARAVEIGLELTATSPAIVLLHGDFHPGNVLSSTREPWLAIDPKPLVGDPAYDLAQWIGNHCEDAISEPNSIAVMRRQIDRFSNSLGLDPIRVAGWAFVKSLGWNWGAPSVRLLHKLVSS